MTTPRSIRPPKSAVEWFGADALRGQLVAIKSVQPHVRNARKHRAKDLEAIRASFQRFGQQRALLIHTFKGDAMPSVIAGNGGLQAALALDWPAIAVVCFRGTDAEAEAYAIADNRTAEMSEWDRAAVELQAQAMRSIDSLRGMYEALDLKSLLRAPATSEDGPIPDPPKRPKSKRGVLYQLGDHRLLCGDATIADDVARLMGEERAGLMNTDPPYGVAYANDDRPGVKKATPRIANDNLHDDKLQKFLEAAFGAAAKSALRGNAAWYLWHAHLTQGFFAAAAAAANVVLSRQIVWIKPTMLLTRGQYHWKHEPCFFGWVKGHQPPDYGLGGGERTQTTVWEIEGISRADRGEFNHSTPKPVGLFAIPIVKHLRAGEIAYEPFAGTGPQFIAAEQLGRRCYGIEIEPAYCDVIVARWERLTGKKAKKL